MPSSFRTELITRFTDDGEFIVYEPFEFQSCISEAIIRVLVGFITDFASIPRLLRIVFSPTGSYGKAAVVHDLLYQVGHVNGRTISRAEADAVFNEGMEVLPVWRVTRLLLYYGIRAGGWIQWNKYRRAERQRSNWPASLRCRR